MEKLVFLVLLAVALGNGEISFTSTVYRNRLNVTCSGAEFLGSSGNFISILITKSAGENLTYMASRSKSRTINNFTGSNTDSSKDNSLTLLWQQVYDNVEGTYTCTLYYLDEENTPLLESKELTFNIKDLDPLIATTPKHIQDGLTTTLVMECSSINFGLHGISLPVQMELFHSYNGSEQRIASAVSVDSYSYVFNAKSENGWNIVGRGTSENQTLSLVVIRELPTTAESGKYTCVLNGTELNSRSYSTIQVVKTVNVTASVATKQDIYDRVGEEDRTDHYLSTCNFENGLCGFELTVPSYGSAWQHVQSRVVGDILDHTFGNDSGHFLRVVVRPGSLMVAAARSKEFPPIRRSFCVSFWSYVSGVYAELSVYIRSNSTGSAGSVLVNTVTSSYGWKYNEIPLDTTSQPFTVDLEFRNHNYYTYEGSAIVDDFVVSDINCNG